jgi:hypothetical protein
MSDILHKIITLLSKEEQRNFKLYALRSHEEDDRKDLQLFDYIRKEGDHFLERRALRHLYGKEARRNTYHRLRHRLLLEIGKSVALLHWDKDETIAALHDCTLAMVYRKKLQPEIAEYYLKKAEKRAETLDIPELLDLILGEFLSLSFELRSIDPAQYIQKRSSNRRRLNQLWEIDNVLAMVNHRLRRSQNLVNDDANVMNILRKTVAEFSLDTTIMADPKFRFRMYDAVSKILLEQRDYLALEAYLLETYETFLQEGLFLKSNHEVKLQMLTYIVNALFKNQKISESLAYAERLRTASYEHGQILEAKYEIFYYNSLFLNYSTYDLAEAAKVLQKMLDIERIAAQPQYITFIYLNLGLIEYERKHYQTAIKHIVKLQLHEAFRAADEGLRLRITIFEFALRLQLHEHDILQYRMQQCRNDFSTFLQAPSMQKDREMLGLLERCNEPRMASKHPELLTAIDQFLERFPSDDTEVFKYGEFFNRLH